MKLKINNKLENFAIKTNIPFDNAIVETTLKLSNDEQKILRILLTYVIIMLEYEDWIKLPIVRHDYDLLENYKYIFDGELFLQVDAEKRWFTSNNFLLRDYSKIKWADVKLFCAMQRLNLSLEVLNNYLFYILFFNNKIWYYKALWIKKTLIHIISFSAI